MGSEPIRDVGQASRARRSSALALERSKALVCRNLFREPSELLRIGRYELVGTLGCGGTGTVYEALDPTRDAYVALKTLHGRTATDLYRLKQEFRSLSELAHPNLVALHELSVEGRDAYLTMELVRGRDFVAYVREGLRVGEPIVDEARLREALVQLCEGIQALHGAGKLHRDLKPSNVLVTDEGRVVLLDFGLVHDASERASDADGTPAYMAPEHARGAACASSDWYSFGRMLEESLHGILPLRRGERTSYTRLRSAAHAELAALAGALLHEDPRARPGPRAILAAVRAAHHRASAPRSVRATSEAFVGRERELAALTEAFAESKTRPVFALIRGESGIGKSTLVREFVKTLREQAWVLRGRCYERESVPYKALDSLIDELSCQLLASDHASLLSSADARAALVHMFPVLGRVPALGAPLPSEELHPVELRRRGFAALKALFATLARERPVVLCIDDVQWSDVDSGHLLSALLVDEDAPPLLIVGSDRTDPCLLNPALEELERRAALALSSVPLRELTLGPLSGEEAEELAATLARAEGGAPARLARSSLASLAAESRGNPLFLRELSRAHAQRAQSEQICTQPSLDALLAQRLEPLSDATRVLLELLAIARRPVSTAVVACAAGLDREPHEPVAELRRLRLIHVTRRNECELLEIDHDRIGAAVLARIAPQHRQELHARLARALEAIESVHSTSLVEEYIAAELPAEAARHARHAGDLALAALAFSRAAWLYEQALRLGRWSASERSRLYVDLGRALEHSGRGLDAAEAYLKAVDASEQPLEVAQLQQRAAAHLMYNGCSDRAEALIARSYRAHGLVWPETKLGLLAGIARLSLTLFFPSSPRFSSSKRALHRARAELLAVAGLSLELSDLARNLYNALLAIREAERAGDEVWRARALGARGLLRCWLFLRLGEARGLAELHEAYEHACALDDMSGVADLESQLAVAYFVTGDARKALVWASRWEEHARQLALAPVQLFSMMGLVGVALYSLGELREAERRFGAFAHDSRTHGDTMTMFWIHAHPVHFASLFARDDKRGARVILDQQARLRALHPRFKVLVYTQALCRVECELYWGDACVAERLLCADWAALSQTGHVYFTGTAYAMRARARVAAAALLPEGKRRARLLRDARADLRAHHRRSNRTMRATAGLIAAGAALLVGKRARARAELDAALVVLDAVEAKLVAACARYCQGLLLGAGAGQALMAEASACLREEGVSEPRRWVAWHVPGFRPLMEPFDD